MGRKVLISFLGTGPLESKDSRIYKTAEYRIGDQTLGKYPFVSAAIKKYFKIDSLILVGTAHSMWEEVYRWFSVDNGMSIDDDAYFSIAEACEKANSKSALTIPHQEVIEQSMGCDSKVVLIRYGVNEQEIKENTDIILGLQQYLEKGDELIVDVTHSFRSLPLFMMNLLIYLKNVSPKRIKLSHIYYGMLEMNKELGYAPLIDLNSMMDVNDWITGAYSFSEFGNSYKISKLVESEDKSVSTLLQEFSNLMNLNHLHAIQKISQRLSAIKSKKYQTLIPELTINPIVQSFINQFNVNGDNHSLFQLKVARWQLDHRKYAQAMLTAQESMITYVCEQNKLAWDNYDNREGAKALLSYKYIPGAKCDTGLRKIYQELKPLRNCTAHSIETTKNVPEMLRMLSACISNIESIISQPSEIRRKPVDDTRKRMLINFCNHPSQEWDTTQLDAAKEYGEITDLSFPDISPTASEKELQSLANQIIQKITSVGKDCNTTVHIMGEMTFTFMVVTRLKELGIRCIASTTERKTTYNDDGTKLSEFSFVKFREY